MVFGYILPAVGRIRDFHPLERALAGRTEKSRVEIYTARKEWWSGCRKNENSGNSNFEYKIVVRPIPVHF